VLDDRAPGIRPLGGAARWWLAQSLRALQASLRQAGCLAGVAQGTAPAVIAALAREIGAESGLLERDRAGATPGRGRSGCRRADEIGIAAHRFPGDLLASPSQIRNKENRGYLRVFTPFWRRVQSLGDSALAAAGAGKACGWTKLASDIARKLAALSPRPRLGWWSCARTGGRGEAAAQDTRLKSFLEKRHGLCDGERDRPDRDGHIKTVAASALRRDQPAANLARGALCGGRAPSPCRRHRQFLSELGWRGILPALALRRARSRRTQSAILLRRLPLESTMPRPCAHGSAA
jgi:deoxyribodipyrimidine photo-lyase